MTTVWKFFRAGGFDQVQLDSGADLLALKDLDQKLWVALGCPTRGIEFDSKTLDLIDSDGDGHVRANEVLAAIEWAGKLLKNADSLVKGSDCLVLDDIDDSSEEGKQVLSSARHILVNLGKPDASSISLADMADIEKFVAGLKFNGDGVICAGQIDDACLGATIEDILKCSGFAVDLSGEAGINRDIVGNFFTEAAAYAAWQPKGDAAILSLGEDTMAAADAFQSVKDKVNDYFTRCQLASYDPRAAIPLSRSIEDYQLLAARSLSSETQEVANFPLATVEAGKPLPLVCGVNPAWQGRIGAFREMVVAPLLGDKESLSVHEWDTLSAGFAAFEAWQAEKPAGNVEKLGIMRIREILSGNHQAELDGLMAEDEAVNAEVKTTHLVEKLLRYNRDLFTLVNNFVSFRNFYISKEKAIFQVGTLYLDGRSCELCVKVDDVNKHAGAAAMSGICLVYCDCVRKAEKMSIAAAFTAGDSDYLTVGRNGIFYDRKGCDWDASVVRIVDHPISIHQAFWSPYKKLSRLISEQLQKIAASKASSVESQMIKAVVDNGKATAGAPSSKPAFDVGKFAGIFAAIGLAIGAIGGILASIVSGILGLKFWQIPLALIGLMLMISGPSMAMAWFKLKRRNLAPILDANGWAINARARISILFGTSLTGVAELPKESNRSLIDPFADKQVAWPYYLAIALGICALIGFWYAGIF